MIQSMFAKARSGDEVALGQLLTWVENSGVEALKIKDLLKPKKMAFRIGITGPPGAGKSTLIGGLLKYLVKTNKKVAVLAVDPSSPFSAGAILGDRIRYNESEYGGKIFIRSLSSRGSLGGLSAGAYLQLRVLDACGFDFVVIETVGAGQVEVDIMHVADIVNLILVPESGDSLQAMKAGIMEIADIIVVNKSDRPGAEVFRREIEAALDIVESPRRPIVQEASALQSKGIPELWDQIFKLYENSGWEKRRSSTERLRHEAVALLRSQSELKFRQLANKIKSANDLKKILGLL